MLFGGLPGVVIGEYYFSHLPEFDRTPTETRIPELLKHEK
jgi:hypothetical protein